MAPNKFEKHIKKQLQEREIQPSANAWERLSEKLNDDAPRSKKRNYFWYGIAAGFIGVLIVSVLFFGSESVTNTPDVQIVDTNDEAPRPTESTTVRAEKDVEEAVVENDKTEQTPTNGVQAIDESSMPGITDQVVSVDKINTVDPTSQKAATPNEFKDEMITVKILEIVATVDSLEQNNAALTDAEVDDLLRNAQEEILRDKLFDQKGSVDAMALLTEVEDELDKTFRDQIFDSLKAGFLKVRTAVADRNK